MEAVTGVFRSKEVASGAYAALRRAGFDPDALNLLTPGAPEQEVHSVPTSETEQPGLGSAIGGVVGAALGIAGGFELGAVAAAAVIPGVGPVLATGMAAAALLGVGGAFGGAALGSAAEEKSTPGLPADEVFFYEDALRQGRSVMIVLANGKGEADRARELLAEAGAESLDAARDDWWIGLRDAESEHYRALGHNFEQDADTYRAGFEAALQRDVRAYSWDQAADYLKSRYPKIWNSEAFRRGFERGQHYRASREGAGAAAKP
jgi:hypothetical protein